MSKSQIYIRPALGVKVRHEVTREPLPVSGEFWEDTPYLRRRLRDGDVLKASPPGVVPAATKIAPVAGVKAEPARKSTSKPKKD